MALQGRSCGRPLTMSPCGCLAVAVAVVALLASVPSSHSLRCYECSSYAATADCVLHADTVGVSDCGANPYCRITRLEYRGVIISTSRGCSSGAEGVFNGSVITGMGVMYYYYCSADRCNNGDGNVPPDVHLECYACETYDASSACAVDPASLEDGAAACGEEFDFCAIERAELDGNFRSLKRQCASGSQLPILNGTTTQQAADGTHVTHYTACDLERCNDGDGVVIDPPAPTPSLQCYGCSSVEEESDCVQNPLAVELGVISCSSQFCTIIRRELEGRLTSLSRGCSSSVDLPAVNETVTSEEPEGTVKTHYSACEEDLCNVGDGFIDEKDETLRCYECETKEMDSACFMHPEEVENGVVKCAKKYCAIVRTEADGMLTALTRACMSRSELPDPVVNKAVVASEENVTITTHYRGCQDHLCNKGNGIVSGTDSVRQCFDCSSVESGSECVTDPRALESGVVVCPAQYCTITRREVDGRLTSLSRGCSSSGDMPVVNKVITSEEPEGTVMTHYSACEVDLCNVGDGIILVEPEDLQCYVCETEDQNSNCTMNPSNVENSIETCAKRYCSIIRQEKDGEFWRLTRACASRSELPDVLLNKTVIGVEDNATVTTYFSGCSVDRCNNGDGVIGGATPSVGPAAQLLVAATSLALLLGRSEN